MVFCSRLYLSCAFFMALTQISFGDVGLLNDPEVMTFGDGVKQAKKRSRKNDEKPMRKRWGQQNRVTALPDLDHNDEKPMRKRWDKENPVTTLPDFDHQENDRPKRKRWDRNKPLDEIQNVTPNNPADLPTMAQMRANKKSMQVDDQKVLMDQKKKLMRALSKLEDAPMPSSKALRYDRNRRLEIMRREMTHVNEELERLLK